MSDTIRDDAHEWRQLCQAAFLELDPVSLLQRIAAARSAVFDELKTAFQDHQIAKNVRCAML